VFESGLAAAAFGATALEIYDVVAEAELRVSTLSSWLNAEPVLSREGFVDIFARGEEFMFIASP
jgi:hypothetical protein